jgi:hypothetical protein
MTNFRFWVVSAALAFGLSGCVIVDDDVLDDTGTLTLAWTIEGAAESADCAFFGVDELEITVYDFFEDPVVTSYAPCEEFELTLRLPEGLYSADVTLIDRRDRAVTRTQGLDDIDIIEDSDLFVPIEFSDRSFL